MSDATVDMQQPMIERPEIRFAVVDVIKEEPLSAGTQTTTTAFVCCPLCGDAMQQAQHGVSPEPPVQGLAGRGDVIAILFQGECGTVWEWCFVRDLERTQVFTRLIKVACVCSEQAATSSELERGTEVVEHLLGKGVTYRDFLPRAEK